MLDQTTTKVCPKCSAEFAPKRSNQKYCSQSCQKSATRNTARDGRTIEQQVAIANHYSRARDLAEMLYTAPVDERLGVMKAILEAATTHDSGLRRILTDPKLLRAKKDDKHLFHRRAPGSYKTISQAANAYTQKFFGVSIQIYVKETRAGNPTAETEVHRNVDHGPIPSLTKIKKPKCWHKPLSRAAKEPKAGWNEVEIERINTIVEDTQRKVDHLRQDQAA